MAESLRPAAVDHLPIFITAPGDTDVLFVVMVVFLLLVIFTGSCTSGSTPFPSTWPMAPARDSLSSWLCSG